MTYDYTALLQVMPVSKVQRPKHLQVEVVRLLVGTGVYRWMCFSFRFDIIPLQWRSRNSTEIAKSVLMTVATLIFF